MGKEIRKVLLSSELTIYPCPVTLVTSIDKDSKPNIITISWAGIACSKPEKVTISIKPQRYSYDLIKNSGEFVINIPTTKHVKEMDICGTLSGRNVDKFQLCGFTKINSVSVDIPSIAECPVNLECKVDDIIPLGGHHLFIATIIHKNISEDYCTHEGSHDTGLLDPIIYFRPYYYSIDNRIIGKFGYTLEK